jgi:hypothetical protein
MRYVKVTIPQDGNRWQHHACRFMYNDPTLGVVVNLHYADHIAVMRLLEASKVKILSFCGPGGEINKEDAIILAKINLKCQTSESVKIIIYFPNKPKKTDKQILLYVINMITTPAEYLITIPQAR